MENNITQAEEQKLPIKKTRKMKRNKNQKGKSHYEKFEPNNQNPFVTYNFSELKKIVKNSPQTTALSKIKETLAQKNKEITHLKSLLSEYKDRIESVKEDLYFAENPNIDRYNYFM